MADLTIEYIRTCKQNLFFQTKVKGSKRSKPGTEYTVTYGPTPYGLYQYGWSCTCPAFQFNSRKECKHIQEAKLKKCDWNHEAFMGNIVEPSPDGNCPLCGGETTVIKVGV